MTRSEIIRNLTHDRSSRMWQGDYLVLPYLGSNRHCDSIRMLYHCSYYDGPINGLCLYQGKRCWFETADEVWFEEWCEAEGTPGTEDYCPAEWEKTWSRRFVVLETSDEEMVWEDERHGKFREHVGWHTDYEDGKRAGGTHPQAEWNKFYDWHKVQPSGPSHNGRALAWFGFPGPQEGEIRAP